MVDAPLPIPGATQRDQRAGTGYAMALVGAALFAVNGTVSKVALTGSDLSAVDYTQIRTAARLPRTVPRAGDLRAAQAPHHASDIPFFVFYGMFSFALVQWLYFVAIEHLPIGIALLIQFTGVVLVALWARLVWKTRRPPARVGRAQPDPRRPCARVRALARVDARHGRRRRGGRRRDRARRLPARGRARGRAPRPAHRPLLLAPLRRDRLVGRPAVVDLPVRGAHRGDVAPREPRPPVRARLVARALDDRPRHDRALRADDRRASPLWRRRASGSR